MHRTEGDNNSSNLFVDGPPGTTVEEDWLNAVQEELAYAIEQAGLTLQTASTDTRQQLKAAIDALAALQVPSVVGAYPTWKNAIINGNFDIWQRGASFAAIASGSYHADRFKYTKVTTSAVNNIARSTTVPTQAESGFKSNYSATISVATADAVLDANDVVTIGQIVEGYNYKQFEGNTATLSFWVRGSKTGTYCVAFRNGGNDRSYVVEYTINSADTWEKKTVTVTFDYSGGTWDYTNGSGLLIDWVLMAGSTYQTTSNAWQSGNYLATSNQVNFSDSVTNNLYIAQVQFELGSVATDFEHRNIGTEFELCQRYYEITFAENMFCGDVTNANVYFHSRVFNVRKRSTPTSVHTNGGVQHFPAANPTANTASESGWRAQATANATNPAGYYIYSSTHDSEL